MRSLSNESSRILESPYPGLEQRLEREHGFAQGQCDAIRSEVAEADAALDARLTELHGGVVERQASVQQEVGARLQALEHGLKAQADAHGKALRGKLGSQAHGKGPSGAVEGGGLELRFHTQYMVYVYFCYVMFHIIQYPICHGPWYKKVCGAVDVC